MSIVKENDDSLPECTQFFIFYFCLFIYLFVQLKIKHEYVNIFDVKLIFIIFAGKKLLFASSKKERYRGSWKDR